MTYNVERPPYRQVEINGEMLQVYLEDVVWLLVDFHQIIRAAIWWGDLDNRLDIDEAIEKLKQERRL